MLAWNKLSAFSWLGGTTISFLHGTTSGFRERHVWCLTNFQRRGRYYFFQLLTNGNIKALKIMFDCSCIWRKFNGFILHNVPNKESIKIEFQQTRFLYSVIIFCAMYNVPVRNYLSSFSKWNNCLSKHNWLLTILIMIISLLNIAIFIEMQLPRFVCYSNK